jgi:shikimate dehydrogenase
MNEPVGENNKIDAAYADIPNLRKQIDAIDAQILDLINRRLVAARAIGRIKQQTGKVVVDKRREAEILQRLLSLNKGPLKTGALLSIFETAIAAGRGIQNLRRWAESPPVFAVFGDPVSSSLSPVMHNSALAQSGLSGIYLAFRVGDIAAAVDGIRGFGIRGVSITIPHKVSVMKYLDEVDASAAEIGAVNTIVNRLGILHGYNTDCPGAVTALLEKTIIEDKRVAIVGAGGGARAIGFGINQEGGRLTVINRSGQRGQKLADDLDCNFMLLADVKDLRYDVVINTTPVGMTPHEDQIPVKPELLEAGTVVMDTVCNPLQTRLLKDAAKAGCTTIDGASMLVHQGAAEFELWTGEKAPVDVMRRAVLDELSIP